MSTRVNFDKSLFLRDSRASAPLGLYLTAVCYVNEDSVDKP